MPYKSQAQRKKFHAMLNRGEISEDTVKEFDKASKGKKKVAIHKMANEDDGYRVSTVKVKMPMKKGR